MMKTYAFSYGIANDGINKKYWTALDFWNTGSEETLLTIKIIKHSNSKVIEIIEKNLKPFGMEGDGFLLNNSDIRKNLNDPNDRFRLLITTSENVLIKPFLGDPNGGVNFIPIDELDNTLGK